MLAEGEPLSGSHPRGAGGRYSRPQVPARAGAGGARPAGQGGGGPPAELLPVDPGGLALDQLGRVESGRGASAHAGAAQSALRCGAGPVQYYRPDGLRAAVLPDRRRPALAPVAVFLDTRLPSAGARDTGSGALQRVDQGETPGDHAGEGDQQAACAAPVADHLRLLRRPEDRL
ncbi:hypothetical protein D9M71_664460 [compost metagenome]